MLVCQFIWSHLFVDHFFLPLTSSLPAPFFCVRYSFALSFCFGRTFALSSFWRGHFHPSLLDSGQTPTARFGSRHFHVPLCSDALTAFFSSSFRHSHPLVLPKFSQPHSVQTLAGSPCSSDTCHFFTVFKHSRRGEGTCGSFLSISNSVQHLLCSYLFNFSLVYAFPHPLSSHLASPVVCAHLFSPLPTRSHFLFPTP